MRYTSHLPNEKQKLRMVTTELFTNHRLIQKIYIQETVSTIHNGFGISVFMCQEEVSGFVK